MRPTADGAEPQTVEEVDEELCTLRRTLAAVSPLSKPAVMGQIDALLDRRSDLSRAASGPEKSS